MKCKDQGQYFYKNKKYRPLKIEKKIFFFSYFISEIPHFSYTRFFQKIFNVLPDHSFKELSSWNGPLSV